MLALPGLIEKLQDAPPPCMISKIRPAIVSVPVRVFGVVFAATAYPTLLLPVLEAPLVIVIQLALLTAVQEAVVEDDVTVTDPVVAAEL